MPYVPAFTTEVFPTRRIPTTKVSRRVSTARRNRPSSSSRSKSSSGFSAGLSKNDIGM
ncbi:MAG: hypothetical protein ACO2PN_08455 [Pyrobaculum sp.]